MEGARNTTGSERTLELVTPHYHAGYRLESDAGSAGLSGAVQVGAGVAGALLAGTALAVGLSVKPLHASDVVRAVAETLAISIPVAAGLYAVRREQTASFARLLIVAGLAWAPSVLAMSDHSVPYSLGRVWAWGVAAWLVYLLLAFPLGRLQARADRWVVWSGVVLVAVFYLPTAFFVQFPLPSPWTSCQAGCPANAFVVSDSQPALITSLVDVRDILGVLVYGAGATIVGLRWARGSHTARRIHGPVLAFAIVYFAAAGAFLAARRAAPDADLTEVAGLVALVATPALVLAFVAGLIRWRFAAFSTGRRLASPSEAVRIRDLLADAIDDPSLEVGYWGGREWRWIDESGRPFALPPEGSVRAVTEVSSNGRRIAILVHEDEHSAEAALREVVTGVTLMALANQRLEAEARASLRELSESRSRILTAIDRDRLRIERDLHDGAQQRLIALKIAADRGATTAAGDAEQAAALFRRIGSDASAALDEVRALARGVYPALLVDHGLVEALRDATSRSGIPAEVRASGIRRYPQEVEAAVYFCCLEALQNAEKHSGASSISITLRGNGAIRFEIRDNGCGFDPAVHETGAGLGNIRDRVAVVGGTLRIDSVPGGGTRVAGRVPMMADHVPAEIERLVLRAADGLEDAMGIYRAVRTASGAVVDFAVEHVNDAAVQLDGVSREAQVGKTLGQLRPGYVRSPLFRWHCEALASETPIVREDCEYAGAAGDRRLQIAYEVRAAALGADRLALVWRDITGRKRREHQLQLRAEALGRERDGVCIVRATTGTVVYANPELEQMLGYARGDLEGRAVAELDWVETSAVEGRARMRWRAADRFEAPCRRKDGSRIWCEVSIDGFDDEDLGWCWVAVHRDITANKEAILLLETQREQLGLALRSVPALGYTTDRDLRTTLLFDSLVDPERTVMPFTGSDVDLLGSSLAKHVTRLNARVLVTERRAEVEVDVDIRGPVTVLVVAEPLRGLGGDVLGVVGSVVERSSHRVRPELTVEPARAHRSRARRRR
jgi:PAS domain S-box-containing protein